MRRSTKVGLIILALVIIIPWSLIFWKFGVPVMESVRAGKKQMLTGQKHMDSLTTHDFQRWTERTRKILSNFPSNSWQVAGGNVPEDLRSLKILNICSGDSNSVDYVWMGGFEHTALHAEQLTNGQFKFTAIYNDQSNRVLWPRSGD